MEDVTLLNKAIEIACQILSYIYGVTGSVEETREKLFEIAREEIKEKEQKMEFEMLKESVSVERRKSYADVIADWLTSENKTLMFRASSQREYRSVKASAYQYAKKHNEDYCIYSDVKTLKVYLVRA